MHSKIPFIQLLQNLYMLHFCNQLLYILELFLLQILFQRSTLIKTEKINLFLIKALLSAESLVFTNTQVADMFHVIFL
jgi:hypothetical protein